jgi:hypothetical protein
MSLGSEFWKQWPSDKTVHMRRDQCCIATIVENALHSSYYSSLDRGEALLSCVVFESIQYYMVWCNDAFL